MRLTLEIKMDNSAFDDGNNGYEVARILTTLAAKSRDGVLRSGDLSLLTDINGNTVGVAKIHKY